VHSYNIYDHSLYIWERHICGDCQDGCALQKIIELLQGLCKMMCVDWISMMHDYTQHKIVFFAQKAAHGLFFFEGSTGGEDPHLVHSS